MQSLKFIAVLRIILGWIFLWPFFDKMFGLGFSTKYGEAWIDGVSPTAGFLLYGTRGPFANLFHELAGSLIVDLLFMLGLFFIGFALILGIAMRLAVYSGSLLLFFMWLALIFPKNNPIIDEHIVYIFILFVLLKNNAGEVWGLGNKWRKVVTNRFFI